jgi:RNA polymerase sigma factor (sigma-70 family)
MNARLERPMTISVEALLEQGDFVRALARSLLFDDNDVDDVVQKTWVAALERPPRRRRGIRAWLARVVRNFAHEERRAAERRARREIAAAAPEVVPSSAEIVEREAMRRVVVDAVLSLDEAHRAVVLLRYFEGLPPREIARLLDVPVETVRSRLKRALVNLRHRLDREHGDDRRAWCLALIPLAKPALLRDATAGAAKGMLASIALAKLAAVVVALLALGILVAHRFTFEGSTPRTTARVERSEHERLAVPAATPMAARLADAADEARGRANDDDRRCVSGVVVAVDTAEPIGGLGLAFETGDGRRVRATTNDGGCFRTPRAFETGDLEIFTEDGTFGFFLEFSHDSLSLGRLHVGDRDVEGLRIAHPWTGSVAGRVVDSDDRAVPSAEIGAVAADVRANRVSMRLFDGALQSRSVRTDADGRFALVRLPTDRPICLAARAAGFASRFGDPVAAPASDIVLRLLPESALVGRVEDADGAPIAGASIRVGRYDRTSYDSPVPVDVTTDDEGAFRIAGIGPGTYCAFARLGERKFAHELKEPFDLATGQTLRLRFRPMSVQLAVSGAVVDPSGRPLAGIPVVASQDDGDDSAHSVSDAAGWFSCVVHSTGRFRVVAEKSLFSRSDPVVAEAGASGVTLVHPRAVEVVVRVVDAASREPIGDAEGWLFVGGGERQDLGLPFSTNARGEASPSAMSAGAYDLFVAARGFAPASQTFAVASESAEPRVVDVPLCGGRRVSGVVLDSNGRPRAGARVAVLAECGKIFHSSTVLANAEGVFALDSAPARGGTIGVLDDRGTIRGMQSCADSTDVTIRVSSEVDK